MELSDLVPLKERKKEGWVIKSGYLMYRKLDLIPLAFICEDYVYVIIDHRLKKKVISLISHLLNNNINFFLTIEEVTNPSISKDINKEIINHYFITYIDLYFKEKFKELDFDLISKLVEWSKKEDCFYLIKTQLDDFISKIKRRYMYNYENEFPTIADELKSLWRQIQISEILP
jgi:hypothetical protein